MKTTIATVVAVLGSLAAPALAGRARVPAKPAPAPAAAPAEEDLFKKLPMGDGFDLTRRERAANLPGEAVKEVKLRSLTDAQVAQTFKVRGEEINFCWDRLPSSQRIAGTAVLRLQVEAEGKVTSAEISGDAPSEAASCIREAAEHWVFPRADVPSQVEHAVRLR